MKDPFNLRKLWVELFCFFSKRSLGFSSSFMLERISTTLYKCYVFTETFSNSALFLQNRNVHNRTNLKLNDLHFGGPRILLSSVTLKNSGSTWACGWASSMSTFMPIVSVKMITSKMKDSVCVAIFDHIKHKYQELNIVVFRQSKPATIFL